MQELKIPFPIKGMDKRLAYQEGDAQSTPYAVNVFADDSQEARARGGSRPGLEKRYSASVGAVPTFMEIVTTNGEDGGPIYQIVVVATESSVWTSQVASTVDGLGQQSYTESLTAVGGNLVTEGGDKLITEGSDYLVIATFSFGSIRRGAAVAYQSQVLIGGDGTNAASGSNGVIASNVLTSVSYPDWVASGVNVDDYLVQITGHADAATYKIATVSGGNLTIDGTLANGSCSFRVFKGPKLFDPVTPTVSLVTPTAGFIPADINLVTIYRDRAVWVEGRAWYMSRQGDIGDYDYAADEADGGRAVAGTVSEAGQPGDPITALAPASYDYLLLFAEDTTWVLRGDPGYGGKLFNQSRTIGCIDSAAWCYGSNGEVYFLSKQGLAVMPPNASGPPQLLSAGPLPRELQNIDRFNYATTLAYDQQDRAVAIFVTPRTGTAGSHWIFDTDTQSFWKYSFGDDNHQPVEAVGFSGVPNKPSRVLMCCRDGYVRQFGGTTDDGTAISSTAILGPYNIAGDLIDEGLLTQFVMTADSQSESMTVGVYTEDTAEGAYQAALDGTAPDYTKTITGGRSTTARPRVRGRFFCLKITSTGKWAFEALQAAVERGGLGRR